MDLRIPCLFFATVFGFLVIESRGQPECKAWQNVTDVVKRFDPLNVTCSVYPPCTGFECSGLMSMTDVHENIRFSVSFIHCANPLQFKVALDIPKYPSFNQTLNISKNEIINKTYPLPGLTRQYDHASTEANITVILSSSPSVGDRPLIAAEMNVTIKVMELSSAPSVTTFVLIPNVTFPVPTCQIETPLPSNATPELTDDFCTPFSIEIPCKGKFQMCNKDGKCVCFRGYRWNDAAKQCDTSSPIMTTPSNKGNGPAAWVVVVAVLSTVIVTAGFVIFLVHKHRRHQDRYGQHSVLINNDNDTELDDPDPPMLTG